MSKRFFLLICLLAMCTGCSQRVVDFTIISTRNVDLSRAASLERFRGRVEGVDQVYVIIVPIGTISLKEAVDKALDKIPGAVALVDGVVYQKYHLFAVSYVVEGTPLVDPALAGSPPESAFMIAYVNGHEETTLAHVTQDEYANFRERYLPQRE